MATTDAINGISDSNHSSGNANGNRNGMRATRTRRNGVGAVLRRSASPRTTIGATGGGEDGTLDKAQLLQALVALQKGDFTARLPVDLIGLDGKIADAFNDVMEMNSRM